MLEGIFFLKSKKSKTMLLMQKKVCSDHTPSFLFFTKLVLCAIKKYRQSIPQEWKVTSKGGKQEESLAVESFSSILKSLVTKLNCGHVTANAISGFSKCGLVPFNLGEVTTGLSISVLCYHIGKPFMLLSKLGRGRITVYTKQIV